MEEELVDGLPVFNKAPQATGDGLPILKKKVSTEGLPSGVPSSNNGLNNSLNSLQNITPQTLDYAPVTDTATKQQLVAQDEAIRAKRQAEQQRLSKQLQGNISAYKKANPETADDIDKVLSTVTTQSQDRLTAPTKEELGHEKFMETNTGKVLGTIGYLGSKATKGTLQILKGAAYLANKAVVPSAMTIGSDEGTDRLFEKADEAANFGLTRGDQARFEDNKIIGNLGGLAEFAPAMAGAASTGGATFYLQGLGIGKETIDQAEKDGAVVNPYVKDGFIIGTGIANGLLMNVLGKGLFGKLPAGLRGDIAADISANAIKEAAGKELTGAEFKGLIESGVKNFGDNAAKFGLKYLKGYNKATIDLSALSAANFALKEGVDVVNETPVFNQNLGDLAEEVSHIATETAPFFAGVGVAGDIGKLTKYSNYKNSVVESIMSDPTEANINKVKEDLYRHGFEEQKWTPEEMDATFKQVDKIAETAKKLPRGIPTDKVEAAVDLINGKQELQEQLVKVQEAKKLFDDSIKDLPTPVEQLLTDKLEQANDKLKDIVSDTKTTYSKGIGEEEGKFYKTTNGKKEEIPQSRYELEALERDANKEVKADEPTVTDTKVEKVLPEQKVQEAITEPKEKITETVIEPVKNIEEPQSASETPIAEVKEPVIPKEEQASPKPKEAPVEPENTTSAKNATTDAILKKYGIEIKDYGEKRGRDIVERDADAILNEKGFDPNEFVDKIKKDGYKATDAEQSALAKLLVAHETKRANIDNRLAKEGATINNKTFEELAAEKARLLESIDETGYALKSAGKTSAQSLGARRFILQDDYSLGSMIERTRREANKGEKLTPEQLSEVETKYKDLQKKQADYETKLEKLTAENNQLKGERSFDRLKREAALEERRAKRKSTQESINSDIDATLEALRKKAKEQRSTLSANPIPVEFLPEIAKLAKLYTKKGVTSLEGIADELYNKLKDDFEGLTKEHILESIANIPEPAISSKDPLSAIKSRFKKQISDLQGKTERGDFRRPERSKIKLDKEGEELRDALERARYEWELGLHREALKNRSTGKKALDAATEVLNVPRALLASTDLSAPLRQGLVMTVSHPIIASKAFAHMLKSAVSQKGFDRWFYDLREAPDYRQLKDSKLYIADPHKPELSAKEEQFMSNLAGKIPIIGKLVTGSERAYVGYLNKLRVDIYRQTADVLERSGKTFENSPETYKGLAKWINNATGRGSLSNENLAQGLNNIFFSPRLMASRMNLLLNPRFYYKLPPEIRNMALRDMAKFITVGTTILAIAKLNGAQVEDDPRSSDFGKIRVGDTRYDILGGFGQYAVLVSRLANGNIKNTNTGELKELKFKGEKYDPTYGKTIGTFFRNKLSPVPALATNFILGENAIGEEFDPVKDVPKNFVPLVVQDTYKAMQDEGLIGGLKRGVPATFGIGVQTYDDGGKVKEVRPDKTVAYRDAKYELTEQQQSERENLNKEFLDKKAERLKPIFEKAAVNSKEYKDAKNKTVPKWKKMGRDNEYIKQQLNIIKQNYINKRLQKAADDFSEVELIKKYRDPSTKTLNLPLAEE